MSGFMSSMSASLSTIRSFTKIRNIQQRWMSLTNQLFFLYCCTCYERFRVVYKRISVDYELKRRGYARIFFDYERFHKNKGHPTTVDVLNNSAFIVLIMVCDICAIFLYRSLLDSVFLTCVLLHLCYLCEKTFGIQYC